MTFAISFEISTEHHKRLASILEEENVECDKFFESLIDAVYHGSVILSPKHGEKTDRLQRALVELKRELAEMKDETIKK